MIKAATMTSIPDTDALLPTVEGNPRHKGRMPMFYRNEVDRIREDTRPIGDIASEWGVSFDTIQRVRQVGRFAGIPYIPRDELHMVVTSTGNFPEPVPKRETVFAPNRRGLKRGRPFKGGRREPLTDDEKAMILADRTPAKLLAEKLGVSTEYVRAFRRENGAPTRHPGPLDPNTIARIKADPREHTQIAAAHSLPLLLIKHLKGERRGQVTCREDNDDSPAEEAA